MTDANRSEPETISGQLGPVVGDQGGLDRHVDQVDTAAAQDVGGDPPGGFGTDIGGGSGEMTQPDQADDDGTLE